MKTQTHKLYRIFFLTAMVLTLASCEYAGIGIEFGNGTNSYRECTDYLCSRTWVEEWYDEYDTYYYQELRFYPDNTGTDYLYQEDRYGNQNESTMHFGWDWWNVSYTSIRIDYRNGYSYMDNIQMGGNQLNCLFDNYPAYFTGK
ncbi:hypothetical protein [Bacteroides sp. An51A]|uniref:hypothetical protein n=1 Tax=Bacteroides sp. An51A TaxID=1965640 RepID=UPI000B38C176|nr:hypothetical protein [Bacteroides sp. An51A]OUN79492.1 hypothetical protein B5G04_14410 [Bacteroides sp. An51A]